MNGEYVWLYRYERGQPYVPRDLCSPGPMFPGSYVPWVLCSPDLKGAGSSEVAYGWPFLSIPQTLAATSNFEVDGFISISSTSKIWCRRGGGFILTTSMSKFRSQYSKHIYTYKITFDTAF